MGCRDPQPGRRQNTWRIHWQTGGENLDGPELEKSGSGGRSVLSCVEILLETWKTNLAEIQELASNNFKCLLDLTIPTRTGDRPPTRSLAAPFSVIGCWDEAMAHYNLCISTYPKDRGLWRKLAFVYSRKPNVDALPFFQRMVEIFPDDSNAWMTLARAYEHQQDFDNAIDASRRCVETEDNAHNCTH